MTDKLDYRIPLTLDVAGELATTYLRMSPPAPFEYHFQQNGNTVGKLIIDCGRVSFEGDADAAAATFIEVLRARWSRQWQEQERELRDCRRSAQLSLERVAELEAQLERRRADNEPVAYQSKWLGDGVWRSCSKSRYEKLTGVPAYELRALCVAPHPLGAL
ncbi:hypothetical protein DLC15_05100 [Salmonella enterica subsp. enterica serovar Telelkebir]|nr:hypothetical protein [Salmonella enterica subsp. enterica serovar Telelkebir]